MRIHTTNHDLAAYMADTLGLECTETLRDACHAARESSRYEDIDAREECRIARAVWAACTDGAEWPFGDDDIADAAAQDAGGAR